MKQSYVRVSGDDGGVLRLMRLMCVNVSVVRMYVCSFPSQAAGDASGNQQSHSEVASESSSRQHQGTYTHIYIYTFTQLHCNFSK